MKKFKDLEVGQVIRFHGWNQQFTDAVVTRKNFTRTELKYRFGDSNETISFNAIEVEEYRTHTHSFEPTKRYYRAENKIDFDLFSILKR